jgi:phosphatidylglycerophosphate synthase
MRNADMVVLLRSLLMFPIAYLILIKFNPIITIFLILLTFFLDFIDGRLARADIKKGMKPTSYGPRLDIAGDRFAEYVFWIVFVYVGIVPLFVALIVFLRHTFVDAFMGARGTSTERKTSVGRSLYSSNIARGGIGVLKAITFSYLVLVYVSGYPIIVGYVLVALLVTYILLRGIAELYEIFSVSRSRVA